MTARAYLQTCCRQLLSCLLVCVLLGGLVACGEVISSGNSPDPSPPVDNPDPSPPPSLLTPTVQSFELDGTSSGDVLLTPDNSRDTLLISTIIANATSATLEVRAATFLTAGTLSPEARCDVLPLPLNTPNELNVSQQSLSWRVTNLPNGIYRFNVSVSDARGNRSEVQPDVTLLRIGFTGIVPCPLAP